jgi:hypothetical protein
LIRPALRYILKVYIINPPGGNYAYGKIISKRAISGCQVAKGFQDAGNGS